MNSIKSLSLAFGGLALGLSSQLFAETNAAGDWVPPSSPPLHESSDLDYKPKGSALYLGAGLDFGQAQPTESGGSAGLSYNLHGELGFISALDDMSRLESSVEVFSGEARFRLRDEDGGAVRVPMTIGALAKIGYGYSMRKDFFAVWKLGIGGALADYKSKVDGVTFESKDSSVGFMVQGAFLLAKSLNAHMEIEGGVEFTHAQFSVEEVEGGGTTVSVDKNIIFNTPGITVGLRFKI